MKRTCYPGGDLSPPGGTAGKRSTNHFGRFLASKAIAAVTLVDLFLLNCTSHGVTVVGTSTVSSGGVGSKST